MYTILYQPGAYGDLVTSIIDRKDYEISSNRMIPNSERILANKISSATTHKEIDIIYAEFAKEYKAISHHMFMYLILSKHDFILIDTSSDIDFEHCHTRAFTLDPSYHYKSLEHDKKRYIPLINNAKEKTNKIIRLHDILNGNLLVVLKQWIHTPLNEDIYAQFLSTKFT